VSNRTTVCTWLFVCLSSTCNMQIFTPWVTHLRVLSLHEKLCDLCVFVCAHEAFSRSHVCAHVSCVQWRLFHREYAP
jgi:hypothetical protein